MECGGRPRRPSVSVFAAPPQLLTAIKLEEFDYPGAAALGLVMLTISFALLQVLNALQSFAGRRGEHELGADTLACAPRSAVDSGDADCGGLAFQGRRFVLPLARSAEVSSDRVSYGR